MQICGGSEPPPYCFTQSPQWAAARTNIKPKSSSLSHSPCQQRGVQLFYFVKWGNRDEVPLPFWLRWFTRGRQRSPRRDAKQLVKVHEVNVVVQPVVRNDKEIIRKHEVFSSSLPHVKREEKTTRRNGFIIKLERRARSAEEPQSLRLYNICTLHKLFYENSIKTALQKPKKICYNYTVK